jgi:hypothetical protein
MGITNTAEVTTYYALYGKMRRQRQRSTSELMFFFCELGRIFVASDETFVSGREMTPIVDSSMANCIKTLGAYYGRPTWFEKVFPSSRPWSVRTVAPPKSTLGTDLKTKFVTMTVLTVAAFVYIIFMLIYVKIVRLL